MNLALEKALINATIATLITSIISIALWFALGQFGLNYVSRFLIAATTFFGLSGIALYHFWSETKLAIATSIDALTGLLNRSAFYEQLTTMISQCELYNKKFHLLLLDVNKFKHINDTLGHDAGDTVLREVALRLRESLRDNDIVARIGCNEFAIILYCKDAECDYEKVVQKITKTMSDPLIVCEHQIPLLTSIGIATYPTSANNKTELLRFADVALCLAKRTQKPFVVYEPAHLPALTKEGLILLNELKTALTNGECVLWLQPKKNLQTGKIDGAECLIRWYHPTKGIIYPDSFIPLAEQTGLIKNITDFVIKQTTLHYKTLMSEGFNLSLSANISPTNLINPETLPTIIKYVDRARMPPEKFIVEVTETAIVQDLEKTTSVLTALNALGIKVSLDDFGTGASSLSYLKKFPFNEIKLERSFISDINLCRDGYNIVAAAVDLTQKLGAASVAEGVETKEIELILSSVGCNYAQGYYIAKPMPIDDFIKWIRHYYGVDSDDTT